MPLQHRSQITTAISRLNQSAYGTRALAAADFRRILNDSQDVMEWEVGNENDAGYDQGSDLAQNTWLTAWQAGVTLTPDFNFQDIGYLLKDALGGYSVSQPDTGLYEHAFSPQDVNTSRQLPSRTIMKKYGSLGLYVGRDMVCTNFKMSGGKQGRLKVSATYAGSGHVEVDPASYTMPNLSTGLEFAYGPQVVGGLELAVGGTAQVETATAAGTASGTSNATITVTSANLTGSPVVVTVAITTGDTASVQGGKFRAALRLNSTIMKRFSVGGSGATIVLTDRIRAANDATLNMAIGAGTTGITAVASSADTTAGVAATSSKSYSCDLETWELNIDNPAVEEGYRQCSEYLTPDNPESGAIRAEYLLGARKYTLAFTARLNSSDPLRTLLKAQTDVRVRIPIFGTDTNDASLVITHDRARIVNSPETSDVGGFIGISGTIELLSSSGVIGLLATLRNNVISYSS